MKKRMLFVLLAAAMAGMPGAADGAIRFAQPSFETRHTLPVHPTPAARSVYREYLDVGALVAAICLASYLALVARSRRGIFLLTIFSILYFGFWRKGCVCPVGSVQNVTMALSDQTYVLPLTALLFFVIPLVSTLLWGRTFCAAVCPLGAIQDVVILKPVKIPSPLARVLEILPYLYLGIAVTLAATGAGFVICRFDPFVSFFRLTGEPWILSVGAAFLILGIFVARPYCRFLCPYGALLNWASRFSKWRVTITPNECVQSRLCEASCPFDAILKPTAERAPEPREAGLRRLYIILLLAPIIVVACGWAGSRLADPLSLASETVRTAKQIQLEASTPGLEPTVDSESFRSGNEPVSDLLDKARMMRERCRVGGWIFGGFTGLVIAAKLIGLSVFRTRKGYEPDRATCLSCARCFEYCPKEIEKRGLEAGGNGCGK